MVSSHSNGSRQSQLFSNAVRDKDEVMLSPHSHIYTQLYPKHTRSRADSDEGEGSDERGSEDDSDESVEGFHPPPFMFHTTTLTPFSLFMYV